MCEEMRARFFELLNEVVDKKCNNHVYIKRLKYRDLLNEVKAAKAAVYKRSIHHLRLRRYDILTVGGEEKLIAPILSERENVLFYVLYDDLFDVIHETHINTGHGGRTRTLHEVNSKYKNVTFESIIIYLKLCKTCQEKKQYWNSRSNQFQDSVEIDNQYIQNMLDTKKKTTNAPKWPENFHVNQAKKEIKIEPNISLEEEERMTEEADEESEGSAEDLQEERIPNPSSYLEVTVEEPPRRKRKPVTHGMDPQLAFLKSVFQQPEKDESSLFGEFLAHKLRCLDPELREVVMLELHNTFFQVVRQHGVRVKSNTAPSTANLNASFPSSSQE